MADEEDWLEIAQQLKEHSTDELPDGAVRNMRVLIEKPLTETSAATILQVFSRMLPLGPDKIDGPLVREMVYRTFEYLLDAGLSGDIESSGPDETANRYITVLDAVINVLYQKGERVTDLLLVLARYESRRVATADKQAVTIARAIKMSHDPIDVIDANLGYAQFELDRSRFTKARKILQTCEAMIGKNGIEEKIYRPIVLSKLGRAYLYSNEKRAAELFRETILVGESYIDDTRVQQAVAEGHHFLARTLVESGKAAAALPEFVRAKELSTTGLSGGGYFHLSMASALLKAGAPLTEARYHLDQSEHDFRVVRDDFEGDARRRGVLASFELKTDPFRAVSTLEQGLTIAVDHDLPRIRMELMYQLIFIHRALNNNQAALRTMVMLAGLFLGYSLHDLRSFPNSLGLAASKVGALIANRRRSSDDDSSPEDDVVACPCGAHD